MVEKLFRLCCGSNLKTVFILWDIYQKVLFVGSNPATGSKRAQSTEMHLQNFEKLRS